MQTKMTMSTQFSKMYPSMMKISHLSAVILFVACISTVVLGFRPIPPLYSAVGSSSSYPCSSSSLSMKLLQVPRGAPITFDFKVVAGAKGDEWGEVTETFVPTPGYVMYTCVVKYPLGCVIEESQGGTAMVFTEVSELSSPVFSLESYNKSIHR